VFTWAPD